MSSQRQPRLDPLLGRDPPQLLETSRFGTRELRGRELPERGTTPKRQRFIQARRPRPPRRPPMPHGPRLRHQALEPCRVVDSPIHPHHVPGRARHDHVVRPRAPATNAIDRRASAPSSTRSLVARRPTTPRPGDPSKPRRLHPPTTPPTPTGPERSPTRPRDCAPILPAGPTHRTPHRPSGSP